MQSAVSFGKFAYSKAKASWLQVSIITPCPLPLHYQSNGGIFAALRRAKSCFKISRRDAEAQLDYSFPFTILIALSVIAVIDKLGLTPGLAEIILPSQIIMFL